MRTVLASDTAAISIDNKQLQAAKCQECGAKMYPSSLLKPHLTRHRLKRQWFVSEMRKLQDTIDSMRIV